MAHEASSGSEFRPYVSPGRTSPPSSRSRRSCSASFFGVIFGAATVYLALRAGLTVSASIPIAVLVDRGLQEARQVDDPREQHRPDHRLGRRVDRRRRRLHAAGASLPLRTAQTYFKYCTIFVARGGRRHARRPVHDPAAPLAHRQGARQPARTPRAPPAPTCSSPARRAATWRAWSSRASASRSSTSSSTASSASGTRRATWFQHRQGRQDSRRHAQRRHHARVPRRRLHHRAAHRRRARRRAACCRGWCSSR